MQKDRRRAPKTRRSSRRVMEGAVFIVMSMSIGVAGYTMTGASVLESLFMVIITVFSVGYEETIRVDTPFLMVFTMFVIVTGCGSLLYVVGGFIQMAMEGELNRAFDVRRLNKGIESLRNHVIICGYGRMGQILATELESANYPYVVIENNEERVKEAHDHGVLVLANDATEEDVLKMARIEHASTLASVVANDAANVFITLSARNLNSKLQILARGEVASTEAKLLQAGADKVVLPATIGGVRLAHMIVRPSAWHLLDSLENATALNADLEQLGVQVSEIIVPPGEDYAGKTIDQIEIAGEGVYLIVGVRRVNGDMVTKPESSCVLAAGDVVVVIGHGDRKPKFTTEKSAAQEVLFEPSDTQDDDEPGKS